MIKLSKLCQNQTKYLLQLRVWRLIFNCAKCQTCKTKEKKKLFLPSSSLFLTISEMNWAAACWSETKLSSSWRPTSSKVNRWARLGRQQQRRVQWVWPRSEICGGSFKGQREQRKKKSYRTRAKLWALTNNDLNQEFTNSHSKVLSGAGLSAELTKNIRHDHRFVSEPPCARTLALKKKKNPLTKFEDFRYLRMMDWPLKMTHFWICATPLLLW